MTKGARSNVLPVVGRPKMLWRAPDAPTGRRLAFFLFALGAIVTPSSSALAGAFADSLGGIYNVQNPQFALGPPDGQCAYMPPHYGSLCLVWTGATPPPTTGSVIRVYLGPLGQGSVEYQLRREHSSGPSRWFTQHEDWEVVALTHYPGQEHDVFACLMLTTYGYYSNTCWVDAVEIIDPVEETPFEILSANFDKSVYQNGVETAHLTVVTRSNWGWSGSMGLGASLQSNFGDFFDVGTSSFSLSPGEEHTSQYSWPVPALDHPFDCDLSLALSDNGQPAGQLNRPGALGGMLVTQEQLDEQEQRMTQSNCLTPEQACEVSLEGALPYVGIVPDLIGYADAMCRAGEAQRAGDWDAFGAAALGALVSVVDVTFDVLQWAGIPVAAAYEYLPDITGFAMSCPKDVLLALDKRHGSAYSLVDSLGAAVRDGFEDIGRDYSNELLMSGAARMKVGVDGGWTSSDSVAATKVFCLVAGADTLTWFHVGPQPKRFGGIDNPHCASEIEVRGTAVDTIDLGFLHRDSAGAVHWLRYAPFAVTGQSVARLAVADTSAAYPLSMDYDGDGGVDFVLYPEGTSDVPDAQNPSRVRPSIERVVVRPNPFAGSAELSFDVRGVLRGARVDIYDVAGREVRRLTVGDLSPGVHQVAWDGRADDGRRVVSGIYQCVTTFVGGRGPIQRVVVLQ